MAYNMILHDNAGLWTFYMLQLTWYQQVYTAQAALSSLSYLQNIWSNPRKMQPGLGVLST